eukprot:5648523-Pyramimonas_sp.AAC.1
MSCERAASRWSSFGFPVATWANSSKAASAVGGAGESAVGAPILQMSLIVCRTRFFKSAALAASPCASTSFARESMSSPQSARRA